MKFEVKSKSINISCKLFYIFIVTTITVDKTESCRGGSLICKYHEMPTKNLCFQMIDKIIKKQTDLLILTEEV